MTKDRIMVYINIDGDTQLRIIEYEKLKRIETEPPMIRIHRNNEFIGGELDKLEYISEHKLMFLNNGIDDPVVEVHINIDKDKLDDCYRTDTNKLVNDIIHHILKGFTYNGTVKYKFRISGILFAYEIINMEELPYLFEEELEE